MRIMEVIDDELRWQKRYFIDCPVDTELEAPKIRRIEIPRKLARYIRELQDENQKLKASI